MQLYPDPDASALRQTTAAYHGLAPKHVFLGNGCDEVLAHAFFAFFQLGCPLLIPDISYGFYRVYCRLYGILTETMPLTDTMCIDVPAYARADSTAVAGVVIANPNAPTGICLPLHQIEQLLRLRIPGGFCLRPGSSD